MRNALVIVIVGLAAGLLDLIPLVMVKAPLLNMAVILGPLSGFALHRGLKKS